MAKKKSKKTKKSGMNRDVIGMFGYAVAEGFIDSAVGQLGFGLPVDVAETILGYYLKNRRGPVGAVGKVMFYVNGVQVVKGMVSGSNLLGGLLGGQPQSSSQSGTYA